MAEDNSGGHSPPANATGGGGQPFKGLTRTLSRTKAKVLQNLGRADKTSDKIFEENVENFNRQVATAQRLQKELKNYVTCVRAVAQASKTFYDALKDTYEEDWTGFTQMKATTESLDLLWEEYLKTLNEQMTSALSTYTQNFPELKQRIAKRNRKLVDYDSARHNLESHRNAKKKDEVKIAKASDDLDAAEKIYHNFNLELNKDLPQFYESRVNFVASNYRRLFSAEATFQDESAKLKTHLMEAVDDLQAEYDRGALHQSGNRPLAANSVENVADLDHNSTSLSEAAVVVATVDEPTVTMTAGVNSTEAQHVNGNTEAVVTATGGETYEPVTVGAQEVVLEDAPLYENNNVKGESLYELEKVVKQEETVEEEVLDDALYKVPAPNPVTVETVPSTESVPAGILYRVVATHPYAGEDTDELTFEAMDIINVLPFDNPDEQDDGWLMGRKTSDGTKGVFPANFTKKL